MIEVYENPTNKEIEEALQGTLKIQWNLMNSLEGNYEFKKKLEKVEYGIKMKFDIRIVVNGHIEEHPNNNLVTIKGVGRARLDRYWKELERRQKIMKEIFRGLYDEGNQRAPTEEEISGKRKK